MVRQYNIALFQKATLIDYMINLVIRTDYIKFIYNIQRIHLPVHLWNVHVHPMPS